MAFFKKDPMQEQRERQAAYAANQRAMVDNAMDVRSQRMAEEAELSHMQRMENKYGDAFDRKYGAKNSDYNPGATAVTPGASTTTKPSGGIVNKLFDKGAGLIDKII